MRDESWEYRNAKPAGKVSEEYLVPYINDLSPTETSDVLTLLKAGVPRVTNDYWFINNRPTEVTPPNRLRYADPSTRIACQGTRQKLGSIWVDQSSGEMYVRVRDGWEELKWGLETDEKAIRKPQV